MRKAMAKINRQKGAVIVEYAIAALLFTGLLFTVIEIGRWLFIWEALNEATRRGARIAAVCPVNDPYIRTATVFGDPDVSGTQSSPVVPGLSTNDVTITYYKATSAGKTLISSPASVPLTDIDLVQVEIQRASGANYSHNHLAPSLCKGCARLFGGLIFAPKFSTLIPKESLGEQQSPPNHC
jgi:hypothetical protein